MSIQKSLRPYRRRNEKLRRMGFASYAEYLASDLWADIRRRVLERDGRECYGCGRRANTAHHACYTPAGLSGESIDGIWSLCSSCHKFIEFNRDGSKAHINEARSRLKLLTRLNRRKSINNQRLEHEGFTVRCDRCGKKRKRERCTGQICDFCIKRMRRKYPSSGITATVGSQSGKEPETVKSGE